MKGLKRFTFQAESESDFTSNMVLSSFVSVAIWAMRTCLFIFR